VAATPLAWLSGEIGWRPAFQIIALATLLLALASWLVIQDRRPTEVSGRASDKNRNGNENALGSMAAQPQFGFLQCGIVCCLLAAVGGTGLTFWGLWGYPFLVDVRGMGSIEAGNLMMLVPLGLVIGTPVIGRLSDWCGRRKPFLVLAAGGYLVFWLVMALTPQVPGKWVVGMMLFIIGALMGSTVNLCFTVIRLAIPGPVLGRVMGWVNTSSFVGAAVFQVATGWLMDRVGKVSEGGFPPDAYRHAFMLLLGVSAAAFILVFALREPPDKRPQPTDR
jgi:MFS family permease